MTKTQLQPYFFADRERVFVELDAHGLSASLFRFDSGVCGVRLRNQVGELVLLPYQGQQIWRAVMHGRDLTMRSMFTQPYPTQQYLATYGAFFIHCGFTAIGGPSKDDTHPLHGELPNAHYQSAHIELGEDERGTYIALGGSYEHIITFSYNYIAQPLVKLYADSTLFNVSMNITNRMRSPLEYMYLAHINFRPVNGSVLEYSANCTPETVRVRKSIPSHLSPKPSYKNLIEQLAQHPEIHHKMSARVKYDPEAVFTIDYMRDSQGYAHTMQVLPDGSADYVRHRPDQLDKVIRWISRTGDQDCLGMAEVATAEVEGFRAEKAKGNVKTLAAGDTWHCSIDMGAIDNKAVQGVRKKIAQSK
jgi:hypothetical protein